jgi:hypothetical protein
MPYDDGPLRDLLLDPEGVSEPLNAGAPYAEYCPYLMCTMMQRIVSDSYTDSYHMHCFETR